MPHLVTAVVTLLVAWLWFGRGPRATLGDYVVATPVRPVTVATPTTAAPVVAVATAQTAALWSAIYVTRAQVNVADIAAALGQNDIVRAQQLLLSLDDTLAMAEVQAPQTARDVIAQLRLDALAIRQDIPQRADGVAQRLEQLRQALLPLIGAPVPVR